MERICREVLRACRAFCLEWRLGPQDLPSVIKSVLSLLNHSPLRRLGERTNTVQEKFRTPLV